jgi:HD-like signal output (HDOD) protein
LKLAHEYGRLSSARPSDEEIEETMLERHPQLGGWLAGRWNMAASLSDPINWHHDPEWAEERTPVALVYAANRLAHRYGFGCEAETFDPLEDPILGEAGIDAARLAQLDAQAPKLDETARHVVRM